MDVVRDPPSTSLEGTPERPSTASQASPVPRKSDDPPKKKGVGLYLQVLVAIVVGTLIGARWPEVGQAMRPLGDAFVKLIKMLIAPIVFCTVAGGIAGMGDLKKVGRVGAKALLYFEIMTTVALALGLAVVHLVKPGSGVHAKAASLDTKQLDATLAAASAGHPKAHGFVGHLLEMIPETFVGAFTSGDVLQVLFVGVLTGLALASLGAKGKPMLVTMERATKVLFTLVGFVMKLAPVGAFGAMAFTIGKFGIGTLGSLLKLMGTFYATAGFFVVVVLATVLRMTVGLSMWKLLRYLREELVIVLGTASSESALPRLMARLEGLGAKPEVVRLVVPTGYSFNLDGTCIYLTLASLFVAQALDVPLTLKDELSLIAVLLVTSKGAAGVTGSGFVTLAATLAATGSVPVAGLTLLLGVDRFMSEARSLTNFVGNAVATLVVARWENALDLKQAHLVLDAPALAAPLLREADERDSAH